MPLFKKNYLPLLLVETYLIMTLILFYFGPINWPIENESKFLILISLYHLFFIAGYFVYTFFFTKRYNLKVTNSTANSFNYETIILNNFWLILTLAFLCGIISHRNITHSSSYIPWSLYSDFYKGIVDPVGVRRFYASADYYTRFTGNKYVTSLLLLISVFKYSLLPILIFLWSRLSLLRRLGGIFVLLIPLISGVSISLSSINFSYVFIIFICFLILALTNTFQETILEFKKRKFFLFFYLFIVSFSIWQFYYIKAESSMYQVVMQNHSPVDFNYLRGNHIIFKSDKYYLEKGLKKPLAYDIYEKLTVYLVQGYQGMSIALGEKFQTSYGVGHSVFLQRVVDKHLNIKIAERSFQKKISSRWHETVYWHSAYSYFANDVSFPGVSIVMFLLGFYFSMVCIFAIVLHDFIAKLLLPLFGIMFLYMPANNQVFGFLENMAPFWVLTLIFLIQKNKNLRLGSGSSRPQTEITTEV